MTTLGRGARLALVVAVAVFLAAALVIALLGTALNLGQAVANGAFLAIGAIIVVRKPGNVIGPVLIAFAVTWNTLYAADVTADWFAESGDVDVASWITWVFSPLVLFGIWVQVPMILFFPHGRVASTRDRRFLWGTGLYAAMVALFSLVRSEEHTSELQSP